VKPQQKWLYAALAAILATALGAQSAFAWNERGHMSVGYVAYKRLKPATRDRVNALLKLNPKYNDWAGKVDHQMPNASADETEYDLTVDYRIKEGPAKNLWVRLRSGFIDQDD